MVPRRETETGVGGKNSIPISAEKDEPSEGPGEGPLSIEDILGQPIFAMPTRPMRYPGDIPTSPKGDHFLQYYQRRLGSSNPMTDGCQASAGWGRKTAPGRSGRFPKSMSSLAASRLGGVLASMRKKGFLLKIGGFPADTFCSTQTGIGL